LKVAFVAAVDGIVMVVPLQVPDATAALPALFMNRTPRIVLTYPETLIVSEASAVAAVVTF